MKGRAKIRYALLYGPKVFGEPELDYVILRDPEELRGRVVEVPLVKLTNDPLHTYCKCRLKITDVVDDCAYTAYFGHEYYREYIHSLFIRGTSFVECVGDVETDSKVYRVFVGAFTKHRITNSRKKAIRRGILSLLASWANKEDDYFVKCAVYGVIDAQAFIASKKVAPVRWCGIFKVKQVRGLNNT